jgi:hypothetical protein
VAAPSRQGHSRLLLLLLLRAAQKRKNALLLLLLRLIVVQLVLLLLLRLLVLHRGCSACNAGSATAAWISVDVLQQLGVAAAQAGRPCWCQLRLIM